MTELVLHKNIIQTMDDAERAAKAMAASGYFQDARQAAQAIVKVLAGQEMGFGPFAAMTNVHIIKGKPVIGANLQAAAIKSNPRYNYRITTNTNEAVAVEFYERWSGKWESIGVSEFTMKDAKSAGLTGKDNWKKYPRNMLFARAISNGIRWYCPDAFSGTVTYTPDEFDLDVDEDGNAIIEAQVVTESPEIVTINDPPQLEPEVINPDFSIYDLAVEQGKFQNEFNASSAAKHSRLQKQIHSKPEAFLFWAKHYRGFRDGGIDNAADAAALADDEFKAHVAKQRNGGDSPEEIIEQIT